MAIIRSTVRIAACTALIATRKGRATAPAAAFVAHRIGASVYLERDARGSGTVRRQPNHRIPKHRIDRRMSASPEKSTQGGEGLLDIGRSANDDGAVYSDGITMPNWKERIDASIARSRKIRGSNYVQLSTVDVEAMEPRCRTVVFRGFMKGLPDGAVSDALVGGSGVKKGGDGYDCVMRMITDSRSGKVRELDMVRESRKGGKGGSTAEIVWWFPKSNEQYRIRGRLQFVGSNGPFYSSMRSNNYFVMERKQQWGNLSDAAREQFYWKDPGVPHPSGSLGANDAGNVPPGGRDEDGRVLSPPETFLLMLLYPTRVDYLRLGDNYRQVDKWDWGNGDDASGSRWSSTRVSP